MVKEEFFGIIENKDRKVFGQPLQAPDIHVVGMDVGDVDEVHARKVFRSDFQGGIVEPRAVIRPVDEPGIAHDPLALMLYDHTSVRYIRELHFILTTKGPFANLQSAFAAFHWPIV